MNDRKKNQSKQQTLDDESEGERVTVGRPTEGTAEGDDDVIEQNLNRKEEGGPTD